jgi:beta-lactamase regulating signal transducer with metallopeptidase domain
VTDNLVENALAFSSQLIGELANTNISLVVTPLNHNPFVFGVIKPQIVLPEYFTSLEKAEQRILIKHGLTHIANKGLPKLPKKVMTHA